MNDLFFVNLFKDIPCRGPKPVSEEVEDEDEDNIGPKLPDQV